MSKHEIGATSANKLLERSPEDDYILEWTYLLMQEKENPLPSTEGSVVIFRIAQEWLALSTLVVAEIADRRNIHTIPHRSNEILAGIVNLSGQLKLCVRMHNFLEIPYEDVDSKDLAYKRMIAIQKDEDHWIFPVDEVYGIMHCVLEDMENVPVTVSKSTANYLNGVFHWNGKSVGFLNEDLLFYSLRRNLL